jgi:hypothetical protein
MRKKKRIRTIVIASDQDTATRKTVVHTYKGVKIIEGGGFFRIPHHSFLTLTGAKTRIDHDGGR